MFAHTAASRFDKKKELQKLVKFINEQVLQFFYECLVAIETIFERGTLYKTLKRVFWRNFTIQQRPEENIASA